MSLNDDLEAFESSLETALTQIPQASIDRALQSNLDPRRHSPTSRTSNSRLNIYPIEFVALDSNETYPLIETVITVVHTMDSLFSGETEYVRTDGGMWRQQERLLTSDFWTGLDSVFLYKPNEGPIMSLAPEARGINIVWAVTARVLFNPS